MMWGLTSTLTAVWKLLNLEVTPSTIPRAWGGPNTQVISPLCRFVSCRQVETCTCTFELYKEEKEEEWNYTVGKPTRLYRCVRVTTTSHGC